MKSLPVLAWLAAIAALTFSPPAGAQGRAAHHPTAHGRVTYEKLITIHAQANNVPEALVHRVIVRESKYQPDLVGRGGTIGLMQIKLATARGLGYTGDAAGLRDPDTNLAYGIKYLAGAWRAAKGDHTRAMHLYASGYYYVAKRQRLERRGSPEAALAHAHSLKDAAPKDAAAESKEAAAAPVVARGPEQPAKPEAKPEETAATAPNVASAKPKPALKPASAKSAAARRAARRPMVLTPVLTRHKTRSKKLAQAKERVPRPPARVPGGAHAAKPR